MEQFDHRLNTTWWLLRSGYGLVPILAGLDKFFHLLADWTAYLSPAVQNLAPMSPQALMHIVGIVEIAAGLIVLSPWTRLGSYAVTGWLIAIAANLVLSGTYFDIAVRDLVMAAGAYTLGQLTAVRAEVLHAQRCSSHRLEKQFERRIA